MDDDDVFSPLVGRRQLLRSAGAFGLFGLGLRGLHGAPLLRDPSLDAGLDASDLIDLAGGGTMCVLTPAEAQGPYYLDLNLVRSDITEGCPGLATQLLIRVVRASDCSPIAGATVDVWHADAGGVYSGFASQGTLGLTYLRGVQTTDANGQALFSTIYPGWYPGRTTHIHLKVRPTSTSELTTQLYFPQPLNRRVNAIAPYSAHGQNPTTNNHDGLYLPETVVSLIGVGPLQTLITIGVA